MTSKCDIGKHDKSRKVTRRSVTKGSTSHEVRVQQNKSLAHNLGIEEGSVQQSKQCRKKEDGANKSIMEFKHKSVQKLMFEHMDEVQGVCMRSATRNECANKQRNNTLKEDKQSWMIVMRKIRIYAIREDGTT